MQKILEAFLRISGAGTPGVLLTILLEIPIFLFSLGYNWGRINVSSQLALISSLLFFICFTALNLWALKALPFEKRGRVLVKDGPYRFIRHPCYFAKIFFLLPGLAVLFRIWLPVASIPIIMLIWSGVIKEEEDRLQQAFGKEFEQYHKSVGKFLLKLL